MSNNIQITTELSADLPRSVLEERNVGVVGLHVLLDGKDCRDGDIPIQEIYDVYEEKKVLPSTAAVSVGEYEDLFRPYLEEGKTVIHLALSSGISSTYQNACIAAEDLEDVGKVYVVDTQVLSGAIGVLVLKATDMVEAGMEAEDIVKTLEALRPNVDSSFMVTDINFLKHGGRCSALQALGANLLKLKPSISMVGGTMEMGKKYRGRNEDAYREFIKDQFPEGQGYDKSYALVTGALVDDALMEELAADVKKTYGFENVIISEAGAVVMAHGGKGAFGVLFIKE